MHQRDRLGRLVVEPLELEQQQLVDQTNHQKLPTHHQWMVPEQQVQQLEPLGLVLPMDQLRLLAELAGRQQLVDLDFELDKNSKLSTTNL